MLKKVRDFVETIYCALKHCSFICYFTRHADGTDVMACVQTRVKVGLPLGYDVKRI